MKSLEKKLRLVEITPIEILQHHPCACNLSLILKAQQTPEMLNFVCSKDGLALKYASKKLITSELCEIAVKQNGIAIEYIPEKIIKNKGMDWFKHICDVAVSNNGKAVAYIPPDMLTKELIFKAVERSPLCIEYVPRKRITKTLSKLAVRGNGLSLKYIPKRLINKEIVDLAISENAMAIRYVPQDYINQELCNICFDKNCSVLAYLPVEYITEKMCIQTIEQKRFSVEEKYGLYDTSNIALVTFYDFPDEMRNNITILNLIIKSCDNNSSQLLEWNEKVIKKNEEYPNSYKDKRDKEINPLLEQTVEYLLTKKIEIKHIEHIGIEPPELLMENMDFYTKNAKIPLQTQIPTSYNIVPYSKGDVVTYEFSGNEENAYTIYYISDIHIEHQISNELQKISEKTAEEKEQYIIEFVDKKVRTMISNIAPNSNSILLIGGDVADSVYLSAVFYKYLFKYWNSGCIISVLGNHELWDGTSQNDWINPNFKSRSVETIVENYRTIITRDTIFKKSNLLENELYIIYKSQYKNQKGIFDPSFGHRIISEKDILNAPLNELTDLLSKCTFILLGGIGYSGLNAEYNADIGLYRKAITSLEEDRYRSKCFRKVYEKVKQCANNKQVIVLTHTPVYNWTDESCKSNWIYINGHTHRNTIKIFDNGAVLSDNQIGYKPKNWKLKSFYTNSRFYDPFENYSDGIYEVTWQQYKDFNLGKEINYEGRGREGVLYMLKRNKIYMFLLMSEKSLYLMEGGAIKKLKIKNINYYYDNMIKYSEKLNKFVEPYKNLMKKLSSEIKKIGGDGKIHGAIIDISFVSHIYVDPYNGKITPYAAPSMSARLTFDNIQQLIEYEEPKLLDKFLIEYKKKSIPLITEYIVNHSNNYELELLPQVVLGTEMYAPSGIIKKIQFLWEKNIIRIWNDDLLQNSYNDTTPLLE